MISINHWGTFDILNFGDLLFPLILEWQLKNRLGGLWVTLSSPRGGPFPPDPDRVVQPIIRLEEPAFFQQAVCHDAIVLGGGDIVRLDDSALAGLYKTTADEAAAARFMRAFVIDLGLLARAVPVFWNAVGVPIDFAPKDRERIRKALRDVRYLSVRDDASKRRLEAAGVDREITVVPDSSFCLPQLFPARDLEPEVRGLQDSGFFPSHGRVLALQLSFAAEETVAAFSEVLLRLLEREPELNVVLLPIGLVHGDLELLNKLNVNMGSRCYLVRKQVTLKDVMAVISHSTVFAGTSLHGNIAAYVYGVSNILISLPSYAPTKLSECARLLGRERFVAGSPDELLTLSLQTLRERPAHREREQDDLILRRLDSHFDYLAAEIEAASCGSRCIQLSRLSETHADITEFVIEELTRMNAHAENLKSRVAVLQSSVAKSQAELLKIKRSAGWRWLARYGALKHRYLLPVIRRLRFSPTGDDRC